MRDALKYIFQGSIYGKLMLMIGCLMLVPILLIPFYPEELPHIISFIIPSLLAIVSGLLACRIKSKKPDKNLPVYQSTIQESSLPVLFAWCFGFIMGAIPFMITGKMSFIHALFESVSGWTTTGLTVVDVTTMPHIFLFHRSFMQFCGGLGFILMALMLVGGKKAVSLYNAEGHPDRLMPNLKHTVHTIFMIYSGFLVVGTVAYCFFGMQPFDAICHTMSALSTAGFTTQANSIAGYGSFPIEATTIVLMIIGSTNFAVLLLLTRFKFRKLLKVSELRFMFALLAVFVPLAGFSLMAERGMGFFESMHHALFGMVTTFSTTGYATMDYAQWPAFALGLIMVLMIIGGSSGSTAGGIKLSRTYFLLRTAYSNIKKRMIPSRNVTVMNYYSIRGKAQINHALIVDTLGFVVAYVAIVIVGTLLITLTEGCTLFDAAFEFASAFGTVGISNGLTNEATGTLTLIIEMIAMILGRLEIFIVFIGLGTCVSRVKGKIFKA